MNRFRQSWVDPLEPLRLGSKREWKRIVGIAIMKRSNEDLAARSRNGVRKVAGSEAVGHPRRRS